MYLISIICFYKGFMRDNRNYKIWFLLAAFITFSTHDLSQVILSLFLIPVLSPSFTVSRKLIFGLWGLGLLGLFKLYKNLRGLLNVFGDPLLLPTGEGLQSIPSVLDKICQKIGIPPIFAPDLIFFHQTLQHHPMVFTGLLVIALILTIFLIYRLFRRDPFWKIMFTILIVWSAFFYQFAIVMVLLSLYLILFIRDYRNLWQPQIIVIYSTTLIYLLVWFIIIYGSPEVSLKKVSVIMFGFPNFGNYFLYWLIKGWPIMTIVFAIGCLLLLTSFFSNPKRKLPIFVLGAIFITALMTSFFKSYHESRYIFHLYPLIVIVFSMVSIRAISYMLTILPFKRKSAQVLVSVSLTATMFFISQDANPFHAWTVGNRTYQSTRDRIRSIISWKPYAEFHQDHQSPSIFVKDHLSAKDKIVVIGPIHMIGLYHFYTGKVDYAVAPIKTPTYSSLLKKGKLINYVTGSEILGGLPGFKTFLENRSKGVWLLGDCLLLIDENEFYSSTLKEYLRPLVKNPDFIGRDGRTFAVKVR
jgi:hypothetical protein